MEKLMIGMNVVVGGRQAVVVNSLGDEVHIQFEDGTTRFLPDAQVMAEQDISTLKSTDPFVTPQNQSSYDPYSNNLKGGVMHGY